MYPGYFREDMFEEAEDFHHPYFRSKHAAEGIVRTECAIPFRIYRPGIVVGDSRTGETDKPDGPYYVFKFIQKVRSALPAWVPLVGLEGGRINIVPSSCPQAGTRWPVFSLDRSGPIPGWRSTQYRR
jgi:nucleoside-diphosphate-sugar epimerase